MLQTNVVQPRRRRSSFTIHATRRRQMSKSETLLKPECTNPISASKSVSEYKEPGSIFKRLVVSKIHETAKSKETRPVHIALYMGDDKHGRFEDWTAKPTNLFTRSCANNIGNQDMKPSTWLPNSKHRHAPIGLTTAAAGKVTCQVARVIMVIIIWPSRLARKRRRQAEEAAFQSRSIANMQAADLCRGTRFGCPESAFLDPFG